MAIGPNIAWLFIAFRGYRVDADAGQFGRGQARGAVAPIGGRMNHWPFIIAAYGLTGLATIAVTLWSYLAMRRAEAELENKDQGQ